MAQGQRNWPGVWVLSAGMVVAALALAHAAQGGLAERGRILYAQHCANCHGWEGRGELGMLGMGPALNNPDFLAAADDTFLWATIAYGRPLPMAGGRPRSFRRYAGSAACGSSPRRRSMISSPICATGSAGADSGTS